jgi:hypothetical protein
MVIVGKVTLMGSTNWSGGATRNSEDLNLVIFPEVAETYAAHWRQRLAASVPFAGRVEWCRQRNCRKSPVSGAGAPLLAHHRLSRLLGDAGAAARPRRAVRARAGDRGRRAA